MFEYFHNTITMKTEGGIVPCHWKDSALMKRPLNLGELNLNVNSNPDFSPYMQEKVALPAVFKM